MSHLCQNGTLELTKTELTTLLIEAPHVLETSDG